MDIEDVFRALGNSQNMNEASLSDTTLHTRREGPQGMGSPSSLTIRPNDIKWFVPIHNFNSNSDGIKTHLVSLCQTFTFKGRSIAVETRERKIQEERINQILPTQNGNEFFLVPKNCQDAEQAFERSLNRKKVRHV